MEPLKKLGTESFETSHKVTPRWASGLTTIIVGVLAAIVASVLATQPLIEKVSGIQEMEESIRRSESKAEALHDAIVEMSKRVSVAESRAMIADEKSTVYQIEVRELKKELEHTNTIAIADRLRLQAEIQKLIVDNTNIKARNEELEVLLVNLTKRK